MTSIELSPGIVLDPERGAGYVMDPKGGISAIDLKDGSALWHSEAADKPLLLTNDLLIGQAAAPTDKNDVRLTVLRTTDAGRTERESLLPLPPEVQPMLSPGVGSSFVLSAEPLDGDAMLSWEFREHAVRGVLDEFQEILPDEEFDDLEETTAGVMPSAAEPPVPVADLETAIRGQVRFSPTEGLVQPMVEAHRDRETVRLPMTESIPPIAEDSAPAAKPIPEPNFPSRDGRHLLHSSLVRDDDSWNKYLWRIFERESGEEQGKLRSHVNYAPFLVWGDLIIFETQPYSRRIGDEWVEEPLVVRAVDITDGSSVWSSEVRDIFEAPAPPP